MAKSLSNGDFLIYLPLECSHEIALLYRVPQQENYRVTVIPGKEQNYCLIIFEREEHFEYCYVVSGKQN